MPSYYVPSSSGHQYIPTSPVLSHHSIPSHHFVPTSPVLSHHAEPLAFMPADNMGGYGYSSAYNSGYAQPGYVYGGQQPSGLYTTGYPSPRYSYDDDYYGSSSRRSSSRRRRRSSSYSSRRNRDHDNYPPVYYKYRTFGDKIMGFFGMPQAHLYKL